MWEQQDTLDVPTVAMHINRLATRHLSHEQTEPDLPTPPTGGLKASGITPFAETNELLATGKFHLFVKLDKVMVKVRAIHLNEHNKEYLTVLISEVSENVWITVPWYLEFVSFFGDRKFVY